MARRWNIQRGSSEAQGSFRGSPLDSRRIGRDTTTTAIVRANRQGQRPSARPRMPVLTSPGLWPLNMTFSKRGEFGPLYAREPAWPHSCSLSHGGLDERPDVLQLRGILLGCANSTFVDVRIPSRVGLTLCCTGNGRCNSVESHVLNRSGVCNHYPHPDVTLTGIRAVIYAREDCGSGERPEPEA